MSKIRQFMWFSFRGLKFSSHLVDSPSMANDFDYADKLVNQTIHDIAVEAAKLSLSRESQSTDSAEIAETLWTKYTDAKQRLMEKTKDAAETIRKNRSAGIF